MIHFVLQVCLSSLNFAAAVGVAPPPSSDVVRRVLIAERFGGRALIRAERGELYGFQVCHLAYAAIKGRAGVYDPRTTCRDLVATRFHVDDQREADELRRWWVIGVRNRIAKDRLSSGVLNLLGTTIFGAAAIDQAYQWHKLMVLKPGARPSHWVARVLGRAGGVGLLIGATAFEANEFARAIDEGRYASPLQPYLELDPVTAEDSSEGTSVGTFESMRDALAEAAEATLAHLQPL